MLKDRLKAYSTDLQRKQAEYNHEARGQANEGILNRIECELKELNALILEVEVILGKFSKLVCIANEQ